MKKINQVLLQRDGEFMSPQTDDSPSRSIKRAGRKNQKFIEDDGYKQMDEQVLDRKHEKKGLSIELGSLHRSDNTTDQYISEVITESSISLSNSISLKPIVMPLMGDQETDTPYLAPKKKGGSKTSSKISGKKKDIDKYKNRPFKWSTYKFLLAYPRKHWKLTILTNLLIVLTSVLGVYLPLIIGQLLDSTTKVNDSDLHIKLSKTFLQIMVVLSCLQFFRSSSNQIWQQLIYNDMRRDVLKQFLQFDMHFFRKYRNGEIISRMTNDLNSAKAAVSGNIIMFARNLIVSISTISMLFMLSYKLTLAVVAVMPFFTISTTFYSRLSKKYQKIGQQQQADITSLAFEIVCGIISVKSFCGEEIEIAKFDKQLKKSIELSYRKAINNGFYQFFATFFVQLGTLIVLYYGGILVLDHNELSPGELASFIFYSIQLSNSSSTISEAYSKIISATGSFEGVLEMLKYQSIVYDNPNGIDNVQLSGQITFKNIYFQYPGTNVPILKDLNLTINKGEYVALVGASGSGKSTIVQLIERFYDCQKGTISMDSLDIKDMKIKSLRKQIGLVSQEPTLFEGTLRSNITYGSAHYTDKDLDWAVRASGAHSFIHNSCSFPKGLDSFVGERGQTLSGGQKQRIAIARALIKKPKILIFDEATSALDAESEFQVQNAIDDLISADSNNKQEITIIVIAHRLSTIVNCGKICVVSNGVIAECGTHFQLVEQNGIYKNLIDRQMQGMFDLSNNESNEEKE